MKTSLGKNSDLVSASTIGCNTPQVTAKAKVLGKAIYAGDMKLPGMLHAKVLRSPYASATIVRVDTAAARNLAGVVAVLTGADAPKTLWGGHHKERSILAQGCVRFCGEEVAAVVAVTEDIARDALDLIEIEYSELAPVLLPEDALAMNSPTVHPGRSNVSKHIEFERGDVDTAFAHAALVFEETYETHPQYPGYLEPMGTVAHIDQDGRLEVWTSTQSPFLARARLAASLELNVSQVRVHQATTGGGFGGKIIEDDNNLLAGLLALRTGRPVRLINNRLEDFLACPTSLPEKIILKIGMDSNGMIVAKEVTILADCGAYSGLCGEIMHVSAMRSDNMHKLANVRSKASLVYTNTPPHGAFRGFGGTQMLFALNSHIHTMADRLGLDPVAIHLINAVDANYVSIHGWKIGSAGLKDCIKQATQAIDWNTKWRKPSIAPKNPAIKTGVGMAAAMHVSGNRTIGNWDGSTVVVKVNEDGRVFIHSGESDMGQGAATMISQLVAHEMKLPLADVHRVAPDTDHAPYAIGSLASRVTMAAGNAAIVAGRQALEKLLLLASDVLSVPADELEVIDKVVFVRTDPSLRKTYAELARLHIYRNGGEGIHVVGSWDAATQMHDVQLMGNVAPAYSFAAQAVEVEVDTETGQVRVVQSFVSDDCGKALNPMAVHGQSNGAAAQAIGWALFEQLHIESGRISNGNLADYTMPTADSLPRLESGIVDSYEPNGPLGAKGASETAILPGAPAIANAVFEATGVRITSLPITPEKILAGLRALKHA